MKEIENYIRSIRRTWEQGGQEQSYRTALENYLEVVLKRRRCEILQEPGTIERIGAPDFIITPKGKRVGTRFVGHIETKNIGARLDEIEKGEQLQRYRDGFPNLILTDYLEFRFFRDGKKRDSIRIGEIKNGKLVPRPIAFNTLEDAIEHRFLGFTGYQAGSAEDLASLMAGKARVIHDALTQDLSKNPSSSLVDQLKGFRQILMQNMSEEQFVDVYAQTLVYGLFAARYNDSQPKADDFTLGRARDLIPQSSPFLHRLFDYIYGDQRNEKITWALNDLCDLYGHTDIRSLFESLQRRRGVNDPIIHFYETFLGEYDSALRKSRGVYFTPESVVQFIVRAVDFCLKEHFSLARGLADEQKIKRDGETYHRVQILDVATGTGSFLVETVRHIRNAYFANSMGQWEGYVQKHLLPRLHGLELQMAPYAMCHLRLNLLLHEDAYRAQLAEGNRFSVYLSNALEKAHDEASETFAQWLANEANEASRIKDRKPIMVVIGNPPYSGISQNMNMQNPIIDIEPYKYIDGKHFKERKHWLHDDYVKFIRLAEHYVEKNGEGIMGYITNHAWLSNPTFRGMRHHLLTTFDDIYILDLHGSNTRPREYPPQGIDRDENVFDIQKGVAIAIAVKHGKRSNKKLAQVHHMDLWGKRKGKYEFLAEASLDKLSFTRLPNKPPCYFFVPKNFTGEEKYGRGVALNEAFAEISTGIVTARDSLVIDYDRSALIRRIKYFADLSLGSGELRQHFFGNKPKGKYPKGDSRGWKMDDARKSIAPQNHQDFVKPIAYRPFDERHIYYDEKMVDWPRKKIMQNFLLEENWALQISRQQKSSYFQHVFIHEKLAESSLISNRTSEIGFSCPLYLYDEKSKAHRHNFAPQFVRQFEAALKLPFLDDHRFKKPNDRSQFSPLDILDYIYAVLHSPTWREKYKEFLKICFPRVPLPQTPKEFWALAKIGGALRQWHLLSHPDLGAAKQKVGFPRPGKNLVEKVRYRAGEQRGQVLINGDGQYFEPVPNHVWEFYVGGYQPAQKWLKDRRGQNLTYEQTEHYKAIIAALDATHRLMQEIDKVWSP